MKLFLCLLALTAYVSAASVSSVADKLKDNLFPNLINKQIVGGVNATIEEYPYQVSIQTDWSDEGVIEHYCGGSIYSERLVITAAHCVYWKDSNWTVKAGSTYRQGNNSYTAFVSDIIMHEKFNISEYKYDIAIMVLQEPLPLNNVTMKVIELAQAGPSVGELGTVTGYGDLEADGQNSEVLQAVEVPIISREDCNKDYNGDRFIYASMVCAGYRGIGGKDSCQGDSGGPLAINGKLAGIVSFGFGCADPKYPGVYTKVSYFYDWILEKTSKINVQ